MLILFWDLHNGVHYHLITRNVYTIYVTTQSYKQEGVTTKE